MLGEFHRKVEPASAEVPLPAPGIDGAIPETPPVGPPQSLGDGPLVTETFFETDVQEALQILALQAKVDMLVDDQVRGVTSAVIENEPFDTALQRVLLPLGYVSHKGEGRYLVGVPDPDSALFSRISERHDYYTAHLPPSELIALLPERLKRFVLTSEKRNLVIVQAPAQIAHDILEELHRSDQPAVQVILEAMVCVMSPQSALQAGLDLEQGIRLPDGSTLGVAVTGLNMAGNYGAVPGPADFSRTAVVLKALAQEGHLSIRAAPRVMAKDGETAKITIAKETFFSVQPNVQSQFLFRQDIQKIEAGIELDITPVIRGDRISMKIDRAEVSEGIDNPALAERQPNVFPVINRRRVSTTVHVRDGETITIGGLSQRQQVERFNKVPILGDIPYAGRLFQQIDRREEETEVVIFISPRIVREGEPWVEQ